MDHEKARIWFFTDIHGSNACFRKFLKAVENPNKPNVLIVGGDITGKLIVPLVRDGNGNFYTSSLTSNEGRQTKHPVADLARVKKELADVGIYSYECDEHSYRTFRFSPIERQKVFDLLVKERLQEWVKLADTVLPDQHQCQVFVNAGNDDPLYVDEILDRSSRLIRPEGKVCELPCGLKMISMGFSNVTPWKCPRDIDEDQLRMKITKMMSGVTSLDYPKLIFNFHCPPKGTSLDLADKIDPKTFQPEAGLKEPPKEHVGSIAVREAIVEWQPLASLHGHIHQIHARDRIGRTLCFNPGSDYRTGHLQGVFLQINRAAEIEADILTQERIPKLGKKQEDPVMGDILRSLPYVGTFFDAARAIQKLDRTNDE